MTRCSEHQPQRHGCPSIVGASNHFVRSGIWSACCEESDPVLELILNSSRDHADRRNLLNVLAHTFSVASRTQEARLLHLTGMQHISSPTSDLPGLKSLGSSGNCPGFQTMIHSSSSRPIAALLLLCAKRRPRWG